MTASGILPDHRLKTLFDTGVVSADTPPAEGQIQPASIDLRLGSHAWRLRASFLPGPGRTVSDRLNEDVVMHTVDLTNGAVLETGCVYLAAPAGAAETAAGPQRRDESEEFDRPDRCLHAGDHRSWRRL